MISSYQAVYFYLQTLLSLSLSELALAPGQCHGCQWSQLLCTKCQWSTSCQKKNMQHLGHEESLPFFFFSSSMALRPPVLGFHKIWWNRLLPQRGALDLITKSLMLSNLNKNYSGKEIFWSCSHSLPGGSCEFVYGSVYIWVLLLNFAEDVKHDLFQVWMI